jgi:hypothetical protein
MSAIFVCIAKRSYVPLKDDNDEVRPSNLGALKLGLKSLQYEDTDNAERAALYMGPNGTGKMQGAIDLLDKEREENEQAEVPVLNVSPHFGCGHIPHIR